MYIYICIFFYGTVFYCIDAKCVDSAPKMRRFPSWLTLGPNTSKRPRVCAKMAVGSLRKLWTDSVGN